MRSECAGRRRGGCGGVKDYEATDETRQQQQQQERRCERDANEKKGRPAAAASASAPLFLARTVVPCGVRTKHAYTHARAHTYLHAGGGWERREGGGGSAAAARREGDPGAAADRGRLEQRDEPLCGARRRARFVYSTIGTRHLARHPYAPRAGRHDRQRGFVSSALTVRTLTVLPLVVLSSVRASCGARAGGRVLSLVLISVCSLTRRRRGRAGAYKGGRGFKAAEGDRGAGGRGLEASCGLEETR